MVNAEQKWLDEAERRNNMVVKNLKEWDDRVRKAMEPPTQAGQGFSPAIQRMRQTATKRRPQLAR